MNNDSETERYNLELSHTLAPASDWRVVWGAEARLDRSRAAGFLGSPAMFEHSLYRLFANGAWQPDVRWTADLRQAGARQQLQITTASITTERELTAALEQVIRPAGVLLALPDPVVVNADTARTLIMTAYHPGKSIRWRALA